MDVLMYIGILVVSLAGLLKASDWFVDSAEKIGLSFGISPFIIGVTIIAFGTSLPELASSIAAMYDGKSSIVIGNVLGSNITNITLILGIVSVVGGSINLGRDVMGKDVMNIDIPLLITSAGLLWFIVYDREVSIFDAILLLLALVIFLAYSFKSDENEKKDKQKEKASAKSYFLLLLAGIGVYFGAEYTIFAIDNLSQLAGVDPSIIALSVLALGTSLPELIVSITAARKGSTELAVGNVLGSNIFNTYAVMGIPAFFGDIEITDNAINFSLPFMVTITLIFALMCLTKKISRWEGLMLLLLYTFFIGQLLSKVI
ncbi:MAG: calcium/sodium antiporter [Bacteroidota bacterium]